jgi:hypothetical protein
MSLELKKLQKLMYQVATADKKNPVAYSKGDEKFSYEQLNGYLRSELKELAGDYNSFRRNKNTIFELVETTIDTVLPQKVLQEYGQFADIQTFAQGDKPVFTQHITQASRMRAKQFVTKVGLNGIYETFKLDGSSLQIDMTAIGGAAQIGFEEFLDGRITFADVLDVAMEGLDEAIYREVAKALVSVISQLPAANKATGSSFSAPVLDRLLQTSDAYGTSAIYCTYEFAATIVPDTGWRSNEIMDQVWNIGYLANYKGHKVIVLPQSFVDVDNAVKVIDPQYAWIIPTGGNDKPVKIAFEGQTILNEAINQDQSREINFYKKIGVGVVVTNNICSLINTSLTVNNA